jgi:C_GCAxxG_C_C family probable redox protein
MTHPKNAIELFTGNYNCAQSVFASFAEELGIGTDECLKIATAFGGGIARNQLTCGAVTGALMVLGMKYGKGHDDPDEKKQDTYQKANDFLEAFKKLHGSVNCLDLLNGLHMNDPDEKAEIDRQNLFSVNCEAYVRSAVILTETILKK